MIKFKHILFFILLLAGYNANSQDIDFNVRYNGSTDVYEVYARPAFTDPFYFVGGGTQISIVLPASVGDAPLAVTSVNGGQWTDNSQAYAPGVAPLSDFHGIATNGAAVSFVSGEELLLYTFFIPGEDCVPGVRLFENITDPSSDATGMGGGDFKMFHANVFDPLNNNWRLNYFNTGLVCPEAPLVLSNPITILEGGSSSICLPILDINPTDTFTATVCTGSHASAPIITDRTLCLNYTPTTGFIGQDEVCIIVCDVSGLCDIVSVPVTVIPALELIPTQESPVVIVTPITTAQDSTVTVCTEILDHNVSDSFDSSFCGGGQVNGTATANIVASTLCIKYVPNTGFIGTDDVCITVCDQLGNCDPVNIPVSVVPTPVASIIAQTPTLVMPPVVTPEDVTLTVCGPIIDANVSDVHTVTICGQPVNGSAIATVNNIDNSLCVTVDPNPNFVGTDSVCVTVCDQGTLCYSLMVPIEVTPVNDPPFAVNDVNSTQMNNLVEGNVLTNDSDVEGENLTVNTTVMNVTNGNVAIDDLGNYTFTPTTDFIGNGTFQYEVCDDGYPKKCDIADVVIAIMDNTDIANNAVKGVPDNFVMEEGNTLSASIISNDTDPDDDNLTVKDTPVVDPTNGGVVINAMDGTIDYTPLTGFVGTDEFTYQVCDDGTPQSCADVLVTIDVFEDDATNDLYATDDVNSGEVGQAQTGNVVDNDYDPEAGVLTVSTALVNNVDNGILMLNINGTYTYTPTAGFVGNDQFVYTVCDNGSPVACDVATVYLTVLDSKDAPLVITNPITISIDETGSICVPITDPNPGNTFKLFSCTTAPANGIAASSIVAGNLCVDYMPNLGFTGTDDICVIVCDQTGRCDTASVPVTVVPLSVASTVLAAPAVIITPITVTQDFTVDICSPIMDQNVGDTFTATFCGGTPSNGTATATFPITGNTLCLEYKPNLGYTGTDDLCITICNQTTGRCDDINVPVTIIATPKVPEILQNPILVMPPLVTEEDVNGAACGTIIDANVSDVHTVIICGQPVNGVATANVDNTANSLCIGFDPNPNFIGSDSVCVTICDQGPLCYDLMVPIEVIPLNDPPLAIDDINNTQVNIPTWGNVLTNDTDPDGDNLIVTTTPISSTDGTVTIDAAGVYTFIPDEDFIGDAFFEYKVCDDSGLLGCDTRLVSIAVVDITNPDNNEVIGIPDNFLTEDDAVLTASLVSNDSDPDGDLIIIDTDPVSTPANGSLLIYPGGTFLYTPTPGFFGVETFSYKICDSGTPEDCDIVPVTITIIEGDGENDVYATDDSNIGEEDALFIGNVLLNDNDPENGVLTISTTPVVAPLNGTLTLTPIGAYIYQPNPDFVGNDQFVYSVCDSGTPRACDTATVYITVLNVSTELRLKVMLQGPLFGSTNSLMRADLVDKGLVPLAQPYDIIDEPSYATRFTHLHAGDEVTTTGVLNANSGTPDGIVDWVFVEFRDATDSLTTLRTLSALVQRDGDVVDAATGGVIYVDSLPTEFFTVIKHRNHLGAMTAAPVAEVLKIATFDFTTAVAADLYNKTPTYDGLEQVTIAGTKALWAGNSNADNKVKYDGPNNDRFIINANVVLHPSNTSNTLNFDNAIDYYLGDVDMDGKAKYDGVGNDRILIQSNVLTYPLNIPAYLNNFDLFIEQVK